MDPWIHKSTDGPFFQSLETSFIHHDVSHSIHLYAQMTRFQVAGGAAAEAREKFKGTHGPT
jgi:hypothetical protein